VFEALDLSVLELAPAAVPVTPLTVATPMVFVQAAVERHALDRGGFARMTVGRIPGTGLGFAAAAGVFAVLRSLL
jgi:hypothetical protein